ncbi:hypothetical protein NP493_20g05013 [Ridgeia piscesae]|uniref:receptor protein-tyrosine kinase n=1 Tax=Ridgeia piscesae TaxID=27915 RepID=A0AAD9PDY3_RIDPI|nr:hypothetical protein NP493_20g05013 [Ridgeia piscesae]
MLCSVWSLDKKRKRNLVSEQRTFSSHYPGYPSLRLESNTPAGLRLTWHSVFNETSDTVLYAVLMKQSSGKWKVIQWTTNTSFDLCSVGSFRVSPVDRAGSLGVSDETTVDNLPKPGVIQIIQKDDDVKFSGEYFLYSFKFKLPAGWKYTDVGEFVATSLGKLCKSTAVPPLPIFNIQLTEEEDIYEAHIRVHRLGFGCQFFSVVQAVSTCAVPGEPFNFTINLTDCANITGYHCPITYEPPDAVHNVSVEVLPEVGWVSISWVPPLTALKLDHYILEYGLLQRIGSFFIRPMLKVEGSRIIAETDNAVKLKVKTFDVEYGVKILAVTETMSGNETEVHLRKMYPLAQFIIKPPIVKISESRETPRESNDSLVALYVLLPLSGLVLATLVSVLALTRLRRRSQGHKQLTLVDNQEVTYKAFALQKQVTGCMAKNPLYPPILTEPEKSHFKDEWEIAYDRLTLTEIIGCGAFGQVVRGTLHQAKSVKRSSSRTSHTAKGPATQDLTVAIKVLPEHSDESQHRDFIKEIELMKSIGSHPNVVGMIGCCTSPSQPVCLIVEHMPGGDLLHYLRRHRHVSQKVPEKHLSSHDLFSFARQVAVGMEFLSQKGFVHRDLACRNILVSDASTVKIGDFGLTRYIYDDKVYVTHRSGTKLPLKWMAIEAIMDLTFTTASDVWAFGVVLFELTTLGGTPYPTLSNRHLLKELQAGYRMEQPENCPQSL